MQILARIFTQSLKAVGPPFQVAKGDHVGLPYIRDLCGGAFVVLWNAVRGGGYRPDAARVFSNTGVARTEGLSKTSGAAYSNLLEQLVAPCAQVSAGPSSNSTVDPDARKTGARGSP
jgi:hypothetical protein